DPEAPAGSLCLDARGLREQPLAIARRIVRIALRQAGLRGRDLARARIEDVLELVARDGTNARLSLGANFTARLEYERLILEAGPPSLPSSDSIPGPSPWFARSAAAGSAADHGRPSRSFGHSDVLQNVAERTGRRPEDRDSR